MFDAKIREYVTAGEFWFKIQRTENTQKSRSNVRLLTRGVFGLPSIPRAYYIELYRKTSVSTGQIGIVGNTAANICKHYTKRIQVYMYKGRRTKFPVENTVLR